MHDERTNLGQQVARDIRGFFQNRVFTTVIPRNIRLGEAPSHGMPAILYDAKSAAPRPTSRSPANSSCANPLRCNQRNSMADKRPALGRGLSALIPDAPPAPTVAPAPAPAASDRPLEIDSDLLRPNRFQPRVHVDDAKIDDLARSIRTNGIIQPIVVRKVDDGYEIVAGERRWRAAQRAGLLRVPVVVRDIPDDRLLAAALIENIQREDLNPIEEAQAYRRLGDDFHLTQEQIADAVGKDRSSVATTCACFDSRTRSARTSPPARCRWGTLAPYSP